LNFQKLKIESLSLNKEKEKSIKEAKFVRIAYKISMIHKTSHGVVVDISIQSMVMECGGVVVRKIKMLQDVKYQGMNAKKMTETMKMMIQIIRKRISSNN